MALAIAVYRPILEIGLLADDFALAEWASSGEVVPRSWPYVRPVQLLVWSIAASITPVTSLALTLHVINVAFHAVNAVLAGLLVTRFGMSIGAATAVALMIVAYPSSVEAVVWPSALADILLATSTLAALLCAARTRLEPRHLAGIGGLLAIGLLTKETAVGVAGLFVVAAYVNPLFRRSLSIAAGMSIGFTILYVLGRTVLLGRPAHPGVNVANLWVLIYQPFAALIWPFHELLVGTHGRLIIGVWMALMTATMVLAVGSPRNRFRWSGLLAVLAWVLVSVAPTVGLFVISRDLQGSRYVYLATVGWVIGLTAIWLPRNVAAREEWLRVGGIALLIIVSVSATRAHQLPWREAAQLRDTVVDVIDGLPSHCTRVFVLAAPDNVNGAYVARNGLTEAMRALKDREIAFVHAASDTTPECRIDFSDLAPR
ncbi:MAG TPA: hypothetical protein VNJ02_13765 [Vicinamibacterales bacterium]|nr:hypothetical protein [Vicinamibacterales bacterium]